MTPLHSGSGPLRAWGVILVALGLSLLVGPFAMRPQWSTPSTGTPSTRAPHLSESDTASVQQALVALADLPVAISEVPAAMARAGGRSGEAADRAEVALVAGQGDLSQLSQAIGHPGTLPTGFEAELRGALSGPSRPRSHPVSVAFLLLVSALPGLALGFAGIVLLRRSRPPVSGRSTVAPFWLLGLVIAAGAGTVVAGLLPVLAGTSTPWGTTKARPQSAGVEAIAADITTQQVMIDEIVPAVEDGGLKAGKLIPPGEAVQLVSADPGLAALSRVINDSPELYGAEEIALGASESGPSVTRVAPAAPERDLVFGAGLVALLSGAVLVLLRLSRRYPSWARPPPAPVWRAT